MSHYNDSYSDDASEPYARSSRQRPATSSYQSYSRESESTYERYRAQARSREEYEHRAQRSSQDFSSQQYNQQRPTQRSANQGYYSSERYDQRGAYQTQSHRRSGSGYAQGGAQSQQQASYSRYSSGARYAEAARRRSNPRSEASGMAGSRNYTEAGARKKHGFSLPLPSFGGRGGSGVGHSQSFSKPRVNFAAARGKIVAILASALTLIVIILLWSNRKIEVTFNGEVTTVRNGSTIDQVIEQAEFETTPGDLISVMGKKLEDNQGYAYLFKLNDEEMDGAATSEYRASDGDAITIEDGRDRTEDYDVVEQEEMPKLEMGGESWGNITYISQWPTKGKYEMRTGKISGETARGDTLAETKNCIVSVHQISPDDGKKLVCLTFDDGPAEGYTEKYLEILNKYGIKATFFNLGQNVEAYPDLAKKIIEQGSEIMSHTYQHQQLSTLDAASLQSEFSNAFDDIESTTGVSTTGFRPPYGDFNESSWLNSGGLASVSVLWNMDSEDWRRVSVESIVEKSTSGIFSGAIILMHDGGGNRDMDVEALPQIIEKLQAEGYEFVTVSELMKSDSSIPEDIASGAATMPEGCTWPTEIASDETSDSTESAS